MTAVPTHPTCSDRRATTTLKCDKRSGFTSILLLLCCFYPPHLKSQTRQVGVWFEAVEGEVEGKYVHTKCSAQRLCRYFTEDEDAIK